MRHSLIVKIHGIIQKMQRGNLIKLCLIKFVYLLQTPLPLSFYSPIPHVIHKYVAVDQRLT